jgi:hypothetical protein
LSLALLPPFPPPSPDATDLTYQAVVKVKGRLAILGEMMLRATAGMMIGEVTRCLRSRLEPVAGVTRSATPDG